MDEERKQQARRRGEDFACWLLEPPQGAIDWRLPNWWTLLVFVCVFVVSMLKPGNHIRDILFDRYYSTGIIGGGLSYLTRITTQLYADKIEQFQPRTALEAKRANEQIKSLATAINALAGSVGGSTPSRIAERRSHFSERAGRNRKVDRSVAIVD